VEGGRVSRRFATAVTVALALVGEAPIVHQPLTSLRAVHTRTGLEPRPSCCRSPVARPHLRHEHPLGNLRPQKGSISVRG
jgi:hypothetical protein